MPAMQWVEIASLLALALSVSSCALSIITLRLQQVPPELSALHSKVQTLDLDLTELADRQNTWMRRDATRTARESKTREPAPSAPVDAAAAKAELRRQWARQRGVNV